MCGHAFLAIEIWNWKSYWCVFWYRVQIVGYKTQEDNSDLVIIVRNVLATLSLQQSEMTSFKTHPIGLSKCIKWKHLKNDQHTNTAIWACDCREIAIALQSTDQSVWSQISVMTQCLCEPSPPSPCSSDLPNSVLVTSRGARFGSAV